MSEHDEKLAQFTDEVLGRKIKMERQAMTPEEAMVIKLERLVSPQASIDPAFRQRVMRQMMEEFDLNRHKHKKARRVMPWKVSPRLTALAAAVMLVLVGGVFLLSSNSGSSSDELSGTTPLASPEALLVLLVLALMSGAGYWLWMRRQS